MSDSAPRSLKEQYFDFKTASEIWNGSSLSIFPESVPEKPMSIHEEPVRFRIRESTRAEMAIEAELTEIFHKATHQLLTEEEFSSALLRFGQKLFAVVDKTQPIIQWTLTSERFRLFESCRWQFPNSINYALLFGKALFQACQSGDLPIVNWILSECPAKFSSPAREPLVNVREILSAACCHAVSAQQFETADWLLNFGTTVLLRNFESDQLRKLTLDSTTLFPEMLAHAILKQSHAVVCYLLAVLDSSQVISEIKSICKPEWTTGNMLQMPYLHLYGGSGMPFASPEALRSTWQIFYDFGKPVSDADIPGELQTSAGIENAKKYCDVFKKLQLHGSEWARYLRSPTFRLSASCGLIHTEPALRKTLEHNAPARHRRL